MAEDLNRKITIDVELDAEKLTENINSLNKTIDGLLAKQQQLNSAGKQNSATFGDISAKLTAFKKSCRR